MSNTYFGSWDTYDAMRRDFDIKEGELFPRADQILFASYGGAMYDGHAVVIYRGDDGELYEVEGSHCSCYGLEDQWRPDVVILKQLAMRKRPIEDTYHFLSEHESDAIKAFWELVADLAVKAVRG